MNIINYAYENKRDKHKIFVRLKMENEGLVLIVEDDGLPFDPLSVPALDFNAPVEKRKSGELCILPKRW